MNGEWVGFFVSLMLLSFILLFGDKIFLVVVGAKEIDERRADLYQKIENLSCLNKLKQIRIYKSYEIPVNIICLQPLFGSPSLIFSNELLNEETEDIITEALSPSLRLLSESVFRFPMFISFLAMIVSSPKFLFEKLKLFRLATAYHFLVGPLLLIKDVVIKDPSQRLFDWEKQSMLQGAHLLNKYPVVRPGLKASLAQDLALISTGDKGLWKSLTQDASTPSHSIPLTPSQSSSKATER